MGRLDHRVIPCRQAAELVGAVGQRRGGGNHRGDTAYRVDQLNGHAAQLFTCLFDAVAIQVFPH